MKRFYISYIYSVFILELAEKPEKTVCFTEANPTLKAYRTIWIPASTCSHQVVQHPH